MKQRILFVLLIILCSASSLEAQKFTVSGSIEAHTAYLWRGSKECGAQVSPCLNFQYGNLMLQSYGFLSFDGTYKEIDWDLSYKIGDFTIHLADYYARLSSYTTPENYFNFKKGETNHIQEVILCYEPEKLPFAIRWFTFVHGDWLRDADGNLGKPSFSSYLEPEVYHQFSPNSKLSLLCGASVFKGNYTGYTKDFAIIHLELRYRHSLTFDKFSIPLQISYVINPYSKRSWLDAGVGFEF